MWKGIPLPPTLVSGTGLIPSPKNDFLLEMSRFGVFWAVFFVRELSAWSDGLVIIDGRWEVANKHTLLELYGCKVCTVEKCFNCTVSYATQTVWSVWYLKSFETWQNDLYVGLFSLAYVASPLPMHCVTADTSCWFKCNCRCL